MDTNNSGQLAFIFFFFYLTVYSNFSPRINIYCCRCAPRIRKRCIFAKKRRSKNCLCLWNETSFRFIYFRWPLQYHWHRSRLLTARLLYTAGMHAAKCSTAGGVTLYADVAFGPLGRMLRFYIRRTVCAQCTHALLELSIWNIVRYLTFLRTNVCCHSAGYCIWAHLFQFTFTL